MMVFNDGLSEHEIRLDGQAHMALSVQSQKTDWVLMTAIPETLYSSDATAVSKSILTALVLALTLMTVVTAFFATRISRPIETLADTMEHMNLRKLEHRVAVVGNDEIARLSISFNTLMDNLSTSIQNEYEMELLQKRSEIRVLQAQMNPHFLYNVLQSISSLAMLDKVSEIITVSNSLGNTLRYCINSSQPLAPLRDEIAHVTNYLTIQTIRFGDRLRFGGSGGGRRLDQLRSRFWLDRLHGRLRRLGNHRRLGWRHRLDQWLHRNAGRHHVEYRLGGRLDARRKRLGLGGGRLFGGRSRLGDNRLFYRLLGFGGRLLRGLRLLAQPAEQTLLLPGWRGLLVVVGTKHVGIESLGDATKDRQQKASKQLCEALNVAARKTDGYPSISSPAGVKRLAASLHRPRGQPERFSPR